MILHPIQRKLPDGYVDRREPKPCATCGAMMNPKAHSGGQKAWEKRRFCSRECIRRKQREPAPVESLVEAEIPEDGVCAAGCGRDLWHEQIERGEKFCWRCQDAGIGRVLEFKRKRDGYRVGT